MVGLCRGSTGLMAADGSSAFRLNINLQRGPFVAPGVAFLGVGQNFQELSFTGTIAGEFAGYFGAIHHEVYCLDLIEMHLAPQKKTRPAGTRF
jgi:hypothetical protein